MKNGVLPHHYFIKKNPDMICKELKCISCSVVGGVLFLEMYRYIDGMKKSNHHQDISVTYACPKQNKIKHNRVRSGYKTSRSCESLFYFEMFYNYVDSMESAEDMNAVLFSSLRNTENSFTMINKKLDKNWSIYYLLFLRSRQ